MTDKINIDQVAFIIEERRRLGFSDAPLWAVMRLVDFYREMRDENAKLKETLLSAVESFEGIAKDNPAFIETANEAIGLIQVSLGELKQDEND